MAYNNYFPAGYQPMYSMQSNAYPTQMGVGNNQPNTQSSLIWVQGEGAAKSYPVAPNQTVALWDSESQTVYLKSADGSGMPNIRILDYTIRDNTSKSPEISPMGDFATKEDMEHLKEELTSLKTKFERIMTKAKEKANG